MAEKININPYRPKPFLYLTTSDPHYYTPEYTYNYLRRMKGEGYGGAVLFNMPPYGFDESKYLGEEWFNMIGSFLEAGKKLDMSLWINDGYECPPGSVAGKIKKIDSSLCQRYLKLIDGRVVVQEAEWGFPAFEEPESSKLFIQLVYEEYYKRFAQYFGNSFVGFFSDADCRRVDADVFLNPNTKKKNYFPWSRNFSETFVQRYAYEIDKHLVDILSGKDLKHVRDYWEHCGYLYSRWFKNNYDWCKSHGIDYTFHTSDSGPFPKEVMQRSSIFTEGKSLDLQMHCDYPGTDHEELELNGGKSLSSDIFYTPEMIWGGNDDSIKSPGFSDVYGDLRAKQAESCAFLHNKKGVMCEMYAAVNWGATYSDLRAIAAYQIMQGVSFIVYQAYHYQLLESVKYFAPPAFSPKSYLNAGIREFNDEISTYAAVAAAGKLLVDIAVLDITEAQWEKKGNCDKLFSICEQLNRLPYGYVISDVQRLVNKKDAFKVVIDPGAMLSEKQKEALNNTGLPVADNVCDAVRYLSTDIVYTGSGKPHFKRRLLEDGQTLTIIANIEDEQEISGNLTVGNKDYELSLFQGEFAWFSEDFCSYRTKTHYNTLEPIAKRADVKWENSNIIPLDRWENEHGEVCAKTCNDTDLYFRFECIEQVENIKLLVPKKADFTLNGERLISNGKEFVLDDECDVYNIGTLEKGTYTLKTEGKHCFEIYDRIIFSGEFNADVQTSGDKAVKCAYQYNLSTFLPSRAVIKLSKRCREISVMNDITAQGHPFYTGSLTYSVDCDLPSGKKRLVLPGVGHVVSLSINGKSLGKRLWQPYEYDISKFEGKCELKLKVNGTDANGMECYRAPFGLSGGILISKDD